MFEGGTSEFLGGGVYDAASNHNCAHHFRLGRKTLGNRLNAGQCPHRKAQQNPLVLIGMHSAECGVAFHAQQEIARLMQAHRCHIPIHSNPSLISQHRLLRMALVLLHMAFWFKPWGFGFEIGYQLFIVT